MVAGAVGIDRLDRGEACETNVAAAHAEEHGREEGDDEAHQCAGRAGGDFRRWFHVGGGLGHAGPGGVWWKAHLPQVVEICQEIFPRPRRYGLVTAGDFGIIRVEPGRSAGTDVGLTSFWLRAFPRLGTGLV